MKQATNLEFSVVICAYTEERWDEILAAVASVQQQTLPAGEIIVVVDHNPELFDRLQSNCQAQNIIVIENRERRGLSGARNSGIAVAKGNVIAFLDDDAIADQDWLERLSEGYRQPEVMGVGGAIEPLWQIGRPAWFPAEFDWVVGCTYLGMPTEVKPVRNLIGCNMSFRREIFEGVGGFRSGIGRVGKRPVGCEETELCIRAHQKWPEKVLVFDPTARVQHRIPSVRGEWRYFLARCYAEGISKALVSRLVGAEDGLNTERHYVMKTLPGGVARGLRDALLKSDPSGVRRAAVIITGFGITMTGYLYASFSRRELKGIESAQHLNKTNQAVI